MIKTDPRRVSMLHLSKKAKEETLTFMRAIERDPPFGDLATITAMSGNQIVGLVEGYHNTYSNINSFHCRSEIMDLISKFPALKSEKGIRIAEIDRSRLEPEYKNKGLGLKMYLMCARLQWERNGGNPFIFIPQECNDEGGSTSVSAKRVWSSLSRKYPSSGYCVAILNKP